MKNEALEFKNEVIKILHGIKRNNNDIGKFGDGVDFAINSAVAKIEEIDVKTSVSKPVADTGSGLHLADVSLSLTESEEEYEPYFGWCDVDGCENEGANGGGCWRETGYWTVCSKHSSKYRAGEPQPPMKQTAIDREKRRGADGGLVNEG